jgi:CheY-like chemotaxis protein
MLNNAGFMKRTILLADDSPTIRRLVTQTFAGANFHIVEVSNGEAAIKQLEELHPQPSIVLADIYMPGKNGYEVCAYVRNHQRFRETPVVLLVGAFDAFDEQVAKNCGATANITKPFEPGALIELVKSLVPPENAEPEAEPESAPSLERSPVGFAGSPPEEGGSRQPARQRVALPPPIVAPQAGAAAPAPAAETEDLLGLETIFKQGPEEVVSGITDEDIDRIADRVIQRLSSQVIESIAWDIVPDITEKIVREELKRIDES